jgi:hypothetical protein
MILLLQLEDKAKSKIVLEDKKKVQKNLYSDWRQSGSLPEYGRPAGKIWKFPD